MIIGARTIGAGKPNTNLQVLMNTVLRHIFQKSIPVKAHGEDGVPNECPCRLPQPDFPGTMAVRPSGRRVGGKDSAGQKSGDVWHAYLPPDEKMI